MARPQFLQFLKHGKLLVQSVFPKFVDTWNYIVKRIDNLKGDADTNAQTGHIKVDNTDPEHPVIRFVNMETASGEVDLSPLNDLVIVTGINYNSNYQIEATRKKITVDNDGVITISALTPQTIDTTPHSGV